MQLVAELPALPRSAPSLPYSSVRSLRPLHASASTTKALWRCAAMVHASCIVRLASCLSLLSGCAIRCAAKCERSARRCAVTHCAEAAGPQVGGAVLGRIPAVHVRAAAAGGAALTALSQRFLLEWIDGWTPHLHRDSARLLPHLHRDWAHPATSAPGLGSPAATSAPGLGSPAATSAPRLGPQKMASVLAASIGPSYNRTGSKAQANLVRHSCS